MVEQYITNDKFIQEYYDKKIDDEINLLNIQLNNLKLEQINNIMISYATKINKTELLKYIIVQNNIYYKDYPNFLFNIDNILFGIRHDIFFSYSVKTHEYFLDYIDRYDVKQIILDNKLKLTISELINIIIIVYEVYKLICKKPKYFTVILN